MPVTRFINTALSNTTLEYPNKSGVFALLSDLVTASSSVYSGVDHTSITNPIQGNFTLEPDGLWIYDAGVWVNPLTHDSLTGIDTGNLLHLTPTEKAIALLTPSYWGDVDTVALAIPATPTDVATYFTTNGHLPAIFGDILSYKTDGVDGKVTHVAMFNGTQWMLLESGVDVSSFATYQGADYTTVVNPSIGDYALSTTTPPHLMLWDGTVWQDLSGLTYWSEAKTTGTVQFTSKSSSWDNVVIGVGSADSTSFSSIVLGGDSTNKILGSSGSAVLAGTGSIVETANNSAALAGTNLFVQSSDSVALGSTATTITKNSLTIGGSDTTAYGQLVVSNLAISASLATTAHATVDIELPVTDKQSTNPLDFKAKCQFEILLESNGAVEAHTLTTTITRTGDGTGAGFVIGNQTDEINSIPSFYCSLATSALGQTLNLQIERVAAGGVTDVKADITSLYTMLTSVIPVTPPQPLVGYYLDPVNGSNTTGNGSLSNPFGSLSGFIAAAGLLERKDSTGAIITTGVVKGGDTLLLKSGYHGDISFITAFFDSALVIKAAPMETPTVGSFKLKAGSNITLDGLYIDGSLGADLNPLIPIIQISTVATASLQSHDIAVQNCFITSGSTYASWDTAGWTANSKTGINIGANASAITIKNCEVIATKIGINTLNSNATIEGNIIEFFSQDGIRVAGNNVMVKYNLITNNVSDNGNHDDGGQMFSATGNSNVTWLKNICLERTTAPNAFITGTQGIGGFDGLYTAVRIEGNVYKGSGIHGFALYDAVDSFLIDNFAVGMNGVGARVSVGTKTPNLNLNNTVTGNTANLINTADDPTAAVSGNTTLTLPDETGFASRLASLQADTIALYGATRSVTGSARY